MTGLAEKIVLIFPTSPLQVLKGRNKVSLQLSLLQAEQPLLFQLVLVGEVFQPLGHFCGLPPDPLQQVHVLVLGAPEPDVGLQVGSHQSRAERQNSLPRPADHASLDAAQGTVGLLGCECMLPAHIWFFIYQFPQVLLLRAALNPFIPILYWYRGLPWPMCRTLAVRLVKLNDTYKGPLPQPSRSLWMASLPWRISISHHSAWYHQQTCWGCTQSHYVINKDIEQYLSQ